MAFAQEESPRIQPSDVLIYEPAKPDVVFIAGSNKGQTVNNRKYIQQLAELGNAGSVGKVTLITSEGCVLKKNTTYNPSLNPWQWIGMGPAMSNTTTWYECPVRVYNPQTKVFEATGKTYKLGEDFGSQFISTAVEAVADGRTPSKSISITRRGTNEIETWLNVMKDPDASTLDASGKFRFLYNASEEGRKWNEAKKKEEAARLEEQAKKMEAQARELKERAAKMREQNMQKSLPRILPAPANAKPILPTPLPLPPNQKPALPDPLLFKVE